MSGYQRKRRSHLRRERDWPLVVWLLISPSRRVGRCGPTRCIAARCGPPITPSSVRPLTALGVVLDEKPTLGPTSGGASAKRDPIKPAAAREFEAGLRALRLGGAEAPQTAKARLTEAVASCHALRTSPHRGQDTSEPGHPSQVLSLPRKIRVQVPAGLCGAVERPRQARRPPELASAAARRSKALCDSRAIERLATPPCFAGARVHQPPASTARHLALLSAGSGPARELCQYRSLMDINL
jgi:hypothetical protein